MSLLMATLAAFAYAIGGIFMKLSHGLSVPIPTLMVYGCFLTGATLQIFLMKGADLGISYIFVLGLEAILAALFGIFIFQEKLSIPHLTGIFLVVVGVALLRSGLK
jgi:small multidrug resistance pump/quaternary ammonium compound-resistance protein SugE